jgi:hypothetical protein
MDPGQFWVQEEVGRHLQRDDPRCRSGTAQGLLSSGTRKGRCYARNPERTDVWEETSSATTRHQWHKGLRHNMSATFEGGDDNQQRHQRTKQETGATSGKQEDII